jgi:hypothetical protein
MKAQNGDINLCSFYVSSHHYRAPTKFAPECRSVCPSVYTQGTTREPLNGFS